MNAVSNDILKEVLYKLEQHLAECGFQGYDPFDALNSPFIKALTFGNRFIQILAVQFFKRCPVNLRKLFRVCVSVNPQAHGILVSAYVEKYRKSASKADLERAKNFAAWLIEHSSQGYSGAAWGYNFDWPNRNAFFPAGTPTIVNTAYIAEALLDLLDVTGERAYLDIARSSADFALSDLNRSGSEGEFCFSYTPLDRTRIHNANLLGAALLARLYRITGETALRDAAMAAARYSINHQREDGSWNYGEERRNRWIDSYHTGYNLLALRKLQRNLEVDHYDEALRRGFQFYLNRFFTPSGYVKYYHDRTYPWDGHAMAHALLTLTELEDLAAARVRELRARVLARVLDTFWDSSRGCFIYQVCRWHVNRIDYYRWVQCWMFYALAKLVTV